MQCKLFFRLGIALDLLVMPNSNGGFRAGSDEGDATRIDLKIVDSGEVESLCCLCLLQSDTICP